MPAIGSDLSRASALNCGLWRERGIVRTSARHSTPWAFRLARKASSDRLECPTVRTVSGMVFQDNPAGRMLDPPNEKGGQGETLIPLHLDSGAASRFWRYAPVAKPSCAADRPGPV